MSRSIDSTEALRRVREEWNAEVSLRSVGSRLLLIAMRSRFCHSVEVSRIRDELGFRSPMSREVH